MLCSQVLHLNSIGTVSSVNYLTASMLISLLPNLLLCHLLRYVTNHLIASLLCLVSDRLISVGQLDRCLTIICSAVSEIVSKLLVRMLLRLNIK